MKVYTSIDAWNKMSFWATLGGKQSREFTCFGRAHHEAGDLYVTDVYLVKQEGTSGGVDGDDEDINRLMMELYAKGIEPDEAFRCWIHSHPGTGKTATYLSGTDDENIERYLTGQWLISIVLDSKGDNPFCQVDIKEPRMSIKADLEIALPTMAEATKKECEEEFKAKSSGRAATYIVPGRGRYLPRGDRPGYEGYDEYYPGSWSGYSGSAQGKGKTNGVQGKGRGKGKAKGKEKGKGGAANRSGNGAVTGGKGTAPGPGGDEMLMYGLSHDEYDAWVEYTAGEEIKEAKGFPSDISRVDTAEIAVGTQEPLPLDVDVIPEWVVSMADQFAIEVEDLLGNIDFDDYDRHIDSLAVSVQFGNKTMDTAIGELEKLGISKAVAKKELETRVNA